MSFTSIVTRELLLEDTTTKQRSPITVEVGAPRWSSEQPHEALCPVRIDGVLDGIKEIRGEDPFQALELALAFVQQLLASGSKAPKVGRVLWPSGEPY